MLIVVSKFGILKKFDVPHKLVFDANSIFEKQILLCNVCRPKNFQVKELTYQDSL